MNLFSNILAQEMESYLDLLIKAGKTTNHIKSLYYELNVVIPSGISKGQALSPEIIFLWDEKLKCAPATRKKKYIALRGFIKYINANGFQFEVPEILKTVSSKYTPYVFDDDEWSKIIDAADNLSCALKIKGSNMPIVFPMVLRILYSCGLRLSEALGLKMSDIDFNKNCIIIRKAKRKRQRLVPMKQSTTDVLRKYCIRKGLFENTY